MGATRLSSGVVRELLGSLLSLVALGAILEDLGAHFGGPGGGLGSLGAPLGGGPGPSWALLGRS